MPRDERRDAHRLQRGQQVADAAVGLVDAVDEDQVRDAELVKHPQRRRGKRGPSRVRVDDDDGDVGNGDAARGIGRKADRAGGVDDPDLSLR